MSRIEASERIMGGVVCLTEIDPEKINKVSEEYGRAFDARYEEHRRKEREAGIKLDQEGWRADF